MAITPTLNRRILELYRNQTVFTDKSSAMNYLCGDAMLAAVTDGELVAARYFRWYEATATGVVTEITYPGSSSETGYTLVNRVGIESGTTLSRDYKAGDRILVPSVSGTYTAYVCTTNASSGTAIAVNDYLALSQSTDKYSTIGTIVGLVTVYGNNAGERKMSFYEDENSLANMMAGYGVYSSDKSVAVAKTSNGYNLSVNIGNSLKKDGSTGVINVNNDELTIVQDSSNNNVLKVNTGKTLTVDGTNGTIDVNAGNSLTVDGTTGVINVNNDGKTIIQDSSNSNKLKVNTGDSLTVNGSTGVINVNIDDATIKQSASGTKPLYVNLDEKTLISDSTDAYKIKVNIDNDTLVSDSSTGVISVSPTASAIYGQNAIEVGNHETGGTVDGKLVTLKINNTEKVLSQDANGLKTTLNVAKYTTTDYDGVTALPTNVRERYRIKNGATATTADSNIGVAIDIYKDSSLVTVFLGSMSDTLSTGQLYGWLDSETIVYTTTDSPSVGDTVWVPTNENTYVYSDNGSITAVGTGTIEVDGATYTTTDPIAAAPRILFKHSANTESLDFLYLTADGSYELVKVDVESFLQESEFSDGLKVTNHVVTANLGTGLSFDSSSPKKIQLKGAATDEIGGIKVGAVNSNAVTGNVESYLNADTSDTTPTSTNGYKRYAVNRDTNNLAYVSVPNASVANYAVSQSGGAGIAGVDNLIVYNNNGELSTLNVWDCGYYN